MAKAPTTWGKMIQVSNILWSLCFPYKVRLMTVGF